MARSFTRAQIRTRALFLADVVAGSGFDPTSNVDDLINTHLAYTYAEIADAGPADHYASSVTLTVSAGTNSYAFGGGAFWSATTADFWRLSMLLCHDGSLRRPVLPFENFERSQLQAPTAGYTLTMEYLPAAPTWSSDASTFDGVAGLEELICLRVARDLKIREESDVSDIERRIGEEQVRLKRVAKRVQGGPRYLRDVEATEFQSPYASTGIRAYRIRGGSIELYELVPFGMV